MTVELPIRCEACVLALVLVSGSAGAARAQVTPPENPWSRGTTIGLFGGVASAASRSGALAGGGVGWEVTPRFGLDGTATWIDRPREAEAFAATLSAHVAILDPGSVVPFVRGGIGLYRMSFATPRDEVPEFYRRRLGPGNTMRDVGRSFTDPSFVFGAGVNFYATRQIAIAPEVGATIVRGGGRSHVVTSVALGVAYHIEDHPITPTR
jgi:hypothetical protein